jgi:hypothetical protein
VFAASSALAPAAQADVPAGCSQSGSTVTCPRSSTGAEQPFTVPTGVTSLQVAAVGGTGQASTYLGSTISGGLGALVNASLPVTPGQQLYVEVGGGGSGAAGGFNGGGKGSENGAGGGGASDVRTCSIAAGSCSGGGGTLGSRLLVAAGGGGAGGGGDASGGAGGSAGASPQPGAAGANSSSTFGGGGGGAGSVSGGGVGGSGAVDSSGTGASGFAGGSGVQGTGGAGAADQQGVANQPGATGGGGGGGGWFGGGGAGSGTDHYIFSPKGFRVVPGSGGGGGAGSSYVEPAATNGSISTAPSGGAASVTISYTIAAVSPTVSSISPSTLAQGASGVVMKVYGTGFVGPAKVSFAGPGKGVGATVISTTATALSIKVTVGASTPPGAYTLKVTGGDGSVATCNGCLTVVAGPTITGISPANVAPGQRTTFTVTGAGFSTDAKLTGPTGVSFSGVSVNSSGTTITATISVASTAPAGTSLPITVKDGSLGNYGQAKDKALTIT